MDPLPDQSADPRIAAPADMTINPSPIGAAGGGLLRVVLILFTGSSALLTMLKAHDVAQIYNWFQQTDGAQFGATVMFVASLAWSQTVTIRKHMKAVLAFWWSPNQIAATTGHPLGIPPLWAAAIAGVVISLVTSAMLFLALWLAGVVK